MESKSTFACHKIRNVMDILIVEVEKMKTLVQAHRVVSINFVVPMELVVLTLH